MPYIKPELRVLYDWRDGARVPQSAGELNYLITDIINNYWLLNKQYQTINDISGALTECLAEFRRRVVVPFENEKLSLNGDVYS